MEDIEALQLARERKKLTDRIDFLRRRVYNMDVDPRIRQAEYGRLIYAQQLLKDLEI